jgi:hypothetical protein
LVQALLLRFLPAPYHVCAGLMHLRDGYPNPFKVFD